MSAATRGGNAYMLFPAGKPFVGGTPSLELARSCPAQPPFGPMRTTCVKEASQQQAGLRAEEQAQTQRSLSG